MFNHAPLAIAPVKLKQGCGSAARAPSGLPRSAVRPRGARTPTAPPSRWHATQPRGCSDCPRRGRS
eukprot:2521309-Lingulodinium_polyedra.AAC.1